MSLADLFQWLKAARKSGVLTIIIAGDDEQGLRFSKGRIDSYTSRELRENLAQLLLGFGLVSEKDITAAIRLQRKGKKPLPNILLDEGFVKEETVRSFLADAARDTVIDLFLEENGNFVFSDAEDALDFDDELPFERVLLELDMEEAILEGMRRMDEWHHVRAKLTHDTLRLKLVKSLGNEDRPQREQRMLACVAQGMSIGEICLELRASRYSVYRLLYRALENGVVAVDNNGPQSEDANGAENDRVRRLLAQAQTMLDAKQWDEAAALYDLILRINPQDAVARAGQRRTRDDQITELYQIMPPISVPRLTVPREQLRDFHISHEELFLATRVNGEWDIGSLVMVSPLTELATLKLLNKLRHIGAVDF